MRQIGSQRRETLEEAGYEYVRKIGNELIVKDKDGSYELWVENNHYAGYVLEYRGIGYEFVTSHVPKGKLK